MQAGAETYLSRPFRMQPPTASRAWLHQNMFSAVSRSARIGSAGHFLGNRQIHSPALLYFSLQWIASCLAHPHGEIAAFLHRPPHSFAAQLRLSSLPTAHRSYLKRVCSFPFPGHVPGAEGSGLSAHRQAQQSACSGSYTPNTPGRLCPQGT